MTAKIKPENPQQMRFDLRRFAALSILWVASAFLIWNALVVPFDPFRTTGSTPGNPIEVNLTELEYMETGVGVKGTVECGGDVVTICTTCGIDYNGDPIPGETFAECLARHRAKKAEVEEACK